METLKSTQLRQNLEQNEEWLLTHSAVKAVIPRFSDPVGLVIIVKDIPKALRNEIEQRFKGVSLKIESGDTELH